jgi:hypothetical protein
MKDFRLISEAQKAKEAAAERARDLAGQATGATEDLKAKAADVKGQIAEQAAVMSEMGLAKLNETLADFNAALPVLREAGYTLDGVDIDLGVSPKIVADFSGGGVSDEKVEALMAENTERNLTVLLMKSIHQAAKLQSRLSVKGMRPRGLSVEIGLVPKVVVKFAPA